MQAALEHIPHSTEASFLVKQRDDRRFDFWWHFHPECELNFIEHSRGRRLVGDAIAEYDDGDLVLIGPDVPHAWSSHADGHVRRHRSIVVQFLPGFLGEEFLRRSELTAIARLLERSRRGLQFVGPVQQRVGRQIQELPRMQGMSRLLVLLSILDELAAAEARPLASAGYVPNLHQGNIRRVNEVLAFIEEHFTERITQADAARIVHLTPSAFSRFFHQSVGKGFKRHVNELRIGRACRLLIETDRPITEIALESGFTNLANFNRRFLEQKGMSPRRFRTHWAEAGQ
jgi:AraC-like DNA-binding protein